MTERTAGEDSGVPTPTGPADSLSRRELLASASATGLGAGLLAGATPAGPVGVGRTAPGGQDTGDGERIRDEAWVETPVDTNDSGDRDRVYVRVARPESTAAGEQYPVIATASPYYGEQTHGDSTPEMLYDRDVAPAASGDTAESAVAASGDLDAGHSSGTGPSHGPAGVLRGEQTLEQRYVPDGYVIARISSLGTHRSTGCYTAAGPPTIEALEAVVDWFNGRATAYDAPTGGAPVAADWTTGRTGLIGTSANGELANGLATTGVDGLEAIVPQSANNGQYSLFRSNGTPISVVPDGSEGLVDLGTWIQAGNARRPDCAHWTEIVEERQDVETGDYNDFWHEREFLPDADAVDAAVLLTHAVDDPIVKPNNVADWYERLADADVPLRLWLHEGGHTAPRGQAWRSLLDRWWDHWLKGVDTGVMDEDPVTVARGGGSAGQESRETYASWPVPDAQPTSVHLAPDGATAGEVTVAEPDQIEESLVDDPSTPARNLVAASESEHRLRYETPPLGQSVHVSGRIVPNLALSVDDPTVVSVALVEYGDGGADVVTRGWADPLNRPSYGEYDSPVAYKESLRESAPVDAGDRMQVEFPLQATDHVFEPGSRIGLVVYASDNRFTLHPPGNATLTLSLAESSVTLPVVGGESALTEALETAAVGDETTASDPTGGTGASGPGFGVGGALAALGGVGYGLKRRLSDAGERRR